MRQRAFHRNPAPQLGLTQTARGGDRCGVNRFQYHSVPSSDGVTLSACERPGPSPEAPTLFLSNGLGGNVPTWRHLIRHFGPTHRIVTWDYRGLYGSPLPPGVSAGEADLSVPAHATDALAICAALGVERAVFVGWSMGVQLNFEMHRRAPERFDGMIALSGGYGRIFSNTVVGKVGEPFLMPGMEAFRALMEVLGGPIARVSDAPVILATMKALGVVGPTLDDAVFSDLVKDFIRLDFRVYNRIMAGLDEHDAESALADVQVPVLIMAGDRDPMTPHRVSQRMHQLLPTSELVILPRGTHYVPVECPDVINRHIEGFLARHFGASSAHTDAAAHRA